jgi:hypothetical protein
MLTREEETIMVSLSSVKLQLAKAGYKMNFWGRAEVKELCRVLADDEEIIHATNGYYEGGFALLVATTQRLLLVDRKPMFLTLDVISYQMVQEISLNYRLLNSTVNIYTSNKVLVFNSWSHVHLRSILNYVQQKVFESRLSYQGNQRPVTAIQVNNPSIQAPQQDSAAFRALVNGTQTPPPSFENQSEVMPLPMDFPTVPNVTHTPRAMLTKSFTEPFRARKNYANRSLDSF